MRQLIRITFLQKGITKTAIYIDLVWFILILSIYYQIVIIVTLTATVLRKTLGSKILKFLLQRTTYYVEKNTQKTSRATNRKYIHWNFRIVSYFLEMSSSRQLAFFNSTRIIFWLWMIRESWSDKFSLREEAPSWPAASSLGWIDCTICSEKIDTQVRHFPNTWISQNKIVSTNRKLPCCVEIRFNFALYLRIEKIRLHLSVDRFGGPSLFSSSVNFVHRASLSVPSSSSKNNMICVKCHCGNEIYQVK